ncbi:hypothetical protein PACTADRAFT_52053 [Pachysolen tannophilus NRRL Y-2460]|uniref:DNA mismatch repair protein MSH3 n=1 Tax=Pachysolen tannophilus NRRL Y-2460 TaxID=669874 RepID=A0A1E4TNZ0_PACTA|nr:hypothetical protein PACTADRAFT_52053 [Pachysolen tannophilus NRRL Y-2460]
MPEQPSISRFFKSSSGKVDNNVKSNKNVEVVGNSRKILSDFKHTSTRNGDLNGNGEGQAVAIARKRISSSLQEPSEDDDLEAENMVTNVSTKKLKKGKSLFEQLTPLEQQFINLKKNNPDKILAIQVGYKFKFFGKDAITASQILNIMLIPGKFSVDIDNQSAEDLNYDKYAYCSIPDNRLHIHLKRLLNKGLKVGIVEQMETAAIKKIGDNKNSLFERKITKVYTSATYIDDENELDNELMFNKSGNCIFSIVENQQADSKSIRISIVAVQLITGEIIYDEFDDDFGRNELETRLLHLDPVEFLLITKNGISISTETNKVLRNFNSYNNRFKKNSSELRILNKNMKKSYNEYLNGLTDYFNNHSESIQKTFDFILNNLSQNIQICCLELIEYLKEFKLDSIFNMVSNYQSFNEIDKHMILDSNTIRNLEIFNNLTDGKEKGSLIWLLDHTRTKYGYRLLKKWASKPLINREDILKRQLSIENIINNCNSRSLENIIKFLSESVDLEKNLNKIHYGKSSRKEIYLFLQQIIQVLEIFNNKNFKIIKNDNFTSDYLANLFDDLNEMSNRSLKLFESFFGMINSWIAKDDKLDLEKKKLEYFNQKFFNYEVIAEELESMRICGRNLDEELAEIRKMLRRPQLQYISNNKEHYLIEVKNSDIKNIPKDWIKFSSTKSVSRFKSPNIIKLTNQLEYHRDLLININDSCFKQFLNEIDSHYDDLNRLVKMLATFDCLLSLSACSSLNLNYNRPELVDKPYIELYRSRNPIIENLSSSLSSYIPNDIRMSYSDNRISIITGPNMGGKSSYIRQVALLVIMTQIGCFVPSDRGSKIGIFDKIFIRMGAQDDLIKGDSTFKVEMNECSSIIKNCTDRSLVLLDEIGRGTSTVEGFAIAYSILDYMINAKSSFILFITHFQSLNFFAEKYKDVVRNFHMGYSVVENNIKNNEGEIKDDLPPLDIVFLYCLSQGVCRNSYGLNVAKMAMIPLDIIQNSYIKAKEMKENVETVKEKNWGFKARALIEDVLRDRNQNCLLESLQSLVENME